jgi:von Willebrand factor type A domain
MLKTPALHHALAFAAIWLAVPGSAWSEDADICEARPKAACLDRALIANQTFDFPAAAMGLARDGLSICDSTYLYTSAPDVILILDNTSSMAKVRTVDGIPRYCELPADPMQYAEDPGCLSGDPDTLRAKALQSFVDSALAKGGSGTRIGVILFSDRILNSDRIRWNVLDSNSITDIKEEIYPDGDGYTNYYTAFNKAVELLQTSTKPREEQTIIFVSDGRPNRPLPNSGGPYQYRQYLEKKMLPPVHSIFLGDQSINYDDLRQISTETGGLFFAIRDVSKMAGILTDSIAKQVFRRARPTSSTVTNLTNRNSFTIVAAGHLPNADTTAYTLKLPGPLALDRAENDILIRTQYGTSGPSIDLRFKIRRVEGNTLDTTRFSLTCRARAQIELLNAAGESMSGRNQPYGLGDSVAVARLVTTADLDTFPVTLRLRERSTARTDAETIKVPRGAAADTVHTTSVRFAHQASEKTIDNGTLDGVQGDRVIAEWRNPWLPEDTAIAETVLRYGPDVLFAAVYDEDEDGRAETVHMRLGQELKAIPERIRLRMKDGGGGQVERIATRANGEIEFGEENDVERADRLVIKLKDPFPITATTTDPVGEAGHFFRQDNAPLADADFAVADSVAPFIFAAEVKEIDRAHVQRRVTVTFTEAVRVDSLLLDVLVFKRDAAVISFRDIPIDHIEVLNANTLDIYLLPGGAFSPVGGDSVAIADGGELRDVHGRAPSQLRFAPLEGKTPTQSVRQFFVTFGDGSRNRPDGGETPGPGGQAIIPIDSTGAPLQGNTEGKCGSCQVGSRDRLNGSVFNAVVPGPVRYEFTIFSNLGVFVNRFSGTIEERDLRFLARKIEGTGDNRRVFYEQRFVWNGLTASGDVANTGAYVLRADFRFDRNAQTGAKASTDTQFKRFGFLRNCCRTQDHNYEYETLW